MFQRLSLVCLAEAAYEKKKERKKERNTD